MSQASRKLPVYISRLTAAENAAIYRIEEVYPAAQLAQAFQGTVSDVVIDRLILAKNCLSVADKLVDRNPTEAEWRAAVNRAYYAVHHAIRAMLLHKNRFEADGHQNAINQLKVLLKDNAAKGMSGLREGDTKDISEARANREVADYSPYGFSRREAEWVPITGDNWEEAAKFNIELAGRVLKAAEKFVGLLNGSV